ncbi:hypothetical protein [Propionispora hippei]|uniref:Peptidase_C39 like family protein n=1 Tax=Propionispora hippei DSM 15287 TaxID=1123003 RepID=A0A1M6G411_9FIRM|nr:hypothetical protein [Propionispora hippei]SHJ04715.1 hypothetical protein SAMN02745170_01614 [Propionispora hippei DSM 15287]
MQIKHPDWLQIHRQQGGVLYGYNQGWYRTSFQRTRGCGPTAAAMLLVYLNRRQPGSLPYEAGNLTEIADILEEVWSFITPDRLLGLNSTGKFCEGAGRLLSHYGLPWRCQRLGISALHKRRPSLQEIVLFLETALAADYPVAFLNLHKGKVMELESWHWLVITGLRYEAEQDRYKITCYDNGRCLTVDLGLWLQTTRFGGGFVYIELPENHE